MSNPDEVPDEHEQAETAQCETAVAETSLRELSDYMASLTPEERAELLNVRRDKW